jgi:hypothetical protein
MMFRIVFWDILPCKMILDRRFRGTYCLHHQGWVDSHFTRQYIPEDNSEHLVQFVLLFLKAKSVPLYVTKGLEEEEV